MVGPLQCTRQTVEAPEVVKLEKWETRGIDGTKAKRAMERHAEERGKKKNRLTSVAKCQCRKD